MERYVRKTLVLILKLELCIAFFLPLFMEWRIVVTSYAQELAQTNTITLPDTQPHSEFEETGQTTRFFISSSQDASLYTSSSQNFVAVTDFFSRKTIVKKHRSLLPSAFVRLSGDGQNLLPAHIQEQTKPMRTLEGTDESHYFFQQTLEGIPIYGSYLAIHLKNKSKINKVNGALVHDVALPNASLSHEGAGRIALAKALHDNPNTSFHISEVKDYLFIGSLAGISNDPTVHRAEEVTVVADGPIPLIGKKYLVSRTTSEVLSEEPLTAHVLSRKIYDCGNGSASCPSVRDEGGAVYTKNGSTANDANKTYDYFGQIYDFFKTKFNRDSFDNSGAVLHGASYFNQSGFCPNAAFWSGTVTGLPNNLFLICEGMAANDILAHEFTHAVTSQTAQLLFTNQSGALNESVSDIFAFGVDPDWTMGEDSRLGVIRRADNPTATGLPDKLFSANYRCGTADDGGVHRNGGVVIHAFYLMAQGGTFNTCTITGVGKDVSLAIWYRALNLYLHANSNFRDAYNAVMSACQDLYPASLCDQVDNAMRATEMDQQQLSRQTAPRCLDPNAVESPVRCITPAPLATNTPVPPTLPLSPTATMTLTPTQPTATPTAVPPSNTPTTIPPTSTPAGTRTPTPTGTLTPSPTRSKTPTVTPSPSPTKLPSITTYPTSSPTPPLSIRPSNTPVPTTLPPCVAKNKGDADCARDSAGNDISFVDFLVWAEEYLNQCKKSNLLGCGGDVDHDGDPMDANFNIPGAKTAIFEPEPEVNLLDYVIWLQNRK